MPDHSEILSASVMKSSQIPLLARMSCTYMLIHTTHHVYSTQLWIQLQGMFIGTISFHNMQCHVPEMAYQGGQDAAGLNGYDHTPSSFVRYRFRVRTYLKWPIRVARTVRSSSTARDWPTVSRPKAAQGRAGAESFRESGAPRQFKVSPQGVEGVLDLLRPGCYRYRGGAQSAETRARLNVAFAAYEMGAR
eukprot:scaffold170985_cov19-Tisochrysis_lutea.AAC.4